MTAIIKNIHPDSDAARLRWYFTPAMSAGAGMKIQVKKMDDNPEWYIGKISGSDYYTYFWHESWLSFEFEPSRIFDLT